MNEEQWGLWSKHVGDYRQHRAEYLHLLRLDEDRLSQARPQGKALKIAHMEKQISALHQLIAECDAVLAVNAELQRHGVGLEAVPA